MAAGHQKMKNIRYFGELYPIGVDASNIDGDVTAKYDAKNNIIDETYVSNVAIEDGSLKVTKGATISDLGSLGVNTNATTSEAGLMSASDKQKLDNLKESIATVAVKDKTGANIGSIAASATQDTTIFKAGNNITMTVSGNEITVNSAGTEYSNATADKNGLMSAGDKQRMDTKVCEYYETATEIIDYQKPATPLRINAGTTGVYPLTTFDQVMFIGGKEEQPLAKLNTVLTIDDNQKAVLTGSADHATSADYADVAGTCTGWADKANNAEHAITANTANSAKNGSYYYTGTLAIGYISEDSPGWTQTSSNYGSQTITLTPVNGAPDLLTTADIIIGVKTGSSLATNENMLNSFAKIANAHIYMSGTNKLTFSHKWAVITGLTDIALFVEGRNP